jgi:hypothetical protein
MIQKYQKKRLEHLSTNPEKLDSKSVLSILTEETILKLVSGTG